MRSILLPLAFVGMSAQAQVPTITPRLTIGCESCAGPDQFGSIWDVSVSAQGELLVTDRDAPMLRRFDASGRSIWTGGRKGKGPGEYGLPIRSAITPNGMIVVDMTNSRVTELADNGVVRATLPVMTMPMAASANARGDLWVGNDNFRGTLRLYRRQRDSLIEEHSVQGSTANVALAVAPDGALAAMLNTKKYEIIRFDSRGIAQAPIVRDIPQVRRTPVEESELRQRLNQSRGMVAAEAKSQGVKATTPVFSQDELSLKDHLVIDGLGFDAAGRLWVLTQRGSESRTVLDVFSPTGALLGSVTVPMKITS